jgi:hypothetical protein
VAARDKSRRAAQHAGRLASFSAIDAMFVWFMTWKIDFQDQESGGLLMRGGRLIRLKQTQTETADRYEI